MRTLRSYVEDRWVAGRGRPATLVNPATEEQVGEASTEGVDFRAALEHARNQGGPALRQLTFAERGALLAAMASALHEHRDELLELSIINGGNTRGDAKFDIDGATGTLAYYAGLGKELGDARFLLDGEPVRLARSARYVGRHALLPLVGAAVHVNAYNFPAWGFAEKAAVALLAGMPVVTKPATSTALLAERMIEILVERRVLPPGTLSFIAGAPGDLLTHVGAQDVLAFTGSGATGSSLRGRDEMTSRSVRVNVEADSLNAAVLGPDVEPATATWDLFVRDVVRDMTQKAGQKCTAIRRILVPEQRLADVRETLVEQLAAIKVGDPSRSEVRMGPLATHQQLDDVRAGIDRLRRDAELAHGDGGRGELTGIADGRGFFVAPVLMLAKNPRQATSVHEHEVFGPVATLMPYAGGAPEAASLVRLGDGSLVSSIYTDDREFAGATFETLAPFHGRLTFGSAKVAEHAVGPGTVLPQMVHGGPGRAGGGEELGALRGLEIYLQRVAIQGDEPLLARLVAAGRPAHHDGPAAPSAGARDAGPAPA